LILSGKGKQILLPREVGKADRVQLKLFESHTGWPAFAIQWAEHKARDPN